MKQTAMSVAREVWDEMSGVCIVCNKPEYEMHEIIGRKHRKTLGVLVCTIFADLAPLCQKCHRDFEKLTQEKQFSILRSSISYPLIQAMHEQIYRMAARRVTE